MTTNRNVIRFVEDLAEDDTGEELFNVLVDISNILHLYAHGSIIYNLNLELRNIGKYYSIKVELKFNHDMRHSRVVDAKKITIEEFIDLNWNDESGLRKTYYELVKAIKNGNNKHGRKGNDIH
jgi:hypothetical protein